MTDESLDVSQASTDDDPDSIVIHHIKSPQYRGIHVDGAYGGTTPQGLVHMALFSERFPLPTAIRHEVLNVEGTRKLARELERQAKDGFVREVEVSAYFTPNTAVSVARWLLEKAVAAGADVQAAGIEISAPDDDQDGRG